MTKEERKEYNKQWRKVNPGYDNQWQQTNPDYKTYQKEYQKSYINGYYRKRKEDPVFRLICNLRVRQWQVLKGSSSTTKGLGCDKEFLKKYVEGQFTEGMSWDNYGNKKGCWSLDHRIPLDSIRTNPELTTQLIHYTNLQPMWHIENIKKSSNR